MQNNNHFFINSISELHSYLNIRKPKHPLVSVINFDELEFKKSDDIKMIVYNFYMISLKKNFDGKIKYGQQYYDFEDGIMTFFAPNQIFSVEANSTQKVEGWMLVFHIDFINSYNLIKYIKNYGFFSYKTNEALHLSYKEENIVSSIMLNLFKEIDSIIDNFTQNLVVSHIELLLNYSNRFYNRQFITRRKASNDLLQKFEEYLMVYPNNEKITVRYLAEKLSISPQYLNDMLKNITGQTTQQHIQNKLVENAKELLLTTDLSVSEIAYQLGFEYSQSFNKFFKNKTNITPLEFRQSFN